MTGYTVRTLKTMLALVVAISLSAVGLSVSAPSASAATSIDPGAAASYVLLAGGAITNGGSSTINGVTGENSSNGIGVADGNAVTLTSASGNFEMVTGSQTSDAFIAAENALSQGLGLTGSSPLTATTTNLTPGVYSAGAALDFAASHTLTLDAEGDANATFVLVVPAALTFGASDVIHLTGGAQAGNVYWIVGAATTVGASSQIVGRVISRDAITLGAGATVVGQLLAVGGAITLSSNSINNTTPSLGSGGTAPASPASPDAETIVWLDEALAATATVGTPYSDGLSVAKSGSPTIEDESGDFALSSGDLPSGLMLDSASGVLAGTPTAVGTYPFRARVAIVGLADAVKSFSIAVDAGTTHGTDTVLWLDDSLPTNVVVGTQYSGGLSVAHSDSPAVVEPSAAFAVSSGQLPPGLVLNSATGVLSGNPTAIGTYVFGIDATIDGHLPVSHAFALVVLARVGSGGRTSAGTSAAGSTVLAAVMVPTVTSGPKWPTSPSGFTATTHSATAADRAVTDIGSARVIYRMTKAGKWSVVLRFRTAAKSIPNSATYTVVKSPIAKQSMNIKSAQKKAALLAKKNHGHVNQVAEGKLWRGPARIIVNW